MEEEEGRKAETDDVSGAEFPEFKRQRDAGAAELSDEVMGWLSVEGSEADSMSELLKLLDDSVETTMSASLYTYSPASYGMRVRFSDNPYSSALIFQSSSSYITINGNEESCGSSFSESESSVMASVDMGGIVRSKVKGLEGIREWLEAEEGGAWGGKRGRGAWVGGGVGMEMGMGRRAADEAAGGVSALIEICE
ncbi:hypothetical protein ES332_A06G086600v1 [Gossypium tomentosum]|uniref:Uncharacterized protein n=1 Tax=Gossypium tomentosum TaxID=34277 RepID=A0A5D2Q269_GOSTO|nr:hypothetical protein ES332_A06G086600v1 [Gossypium tomentosum]